MNHSETIRLMTLNVRHATDPPPNSWEERQPLIKRLLDREKPDMIGTQECFFSQVKDMLGALPDCDWLGLGRSGGSGGEYMAIFYNKRRFELLEYDHYWLSDTPGHIGSATWGNTAPRMVTWGKFADKRTGKTFYWCNTHFDHKSPEARENSARLIVSRTESFDAELPLIVSGDFNVGADSEPYRILTGEGRFSDTWHTAARREGDHLGTFNNFKTEDGRGPSWRIDWILTRGAVEADLIRILDDRDDGRYPSDHYPLVADLRMG